MCKLGFGAPEFAGALFVVHPDQSDARVHGPFFLAEEAINQCKSNSVVYKNSELTRYESNYAHSVAPEAKWLSSKTFIPKPTPRATRSRVSKLVALAQTGTNGAYYAALRDSQFLLRSSLA